MKRRHLLMPRTHGQRLGRLQGFLGFFGKFFDVHNNPLAWCRPS